MTLAILPITPTRAAQIAPETIGDFKVFDGLLFTNKPNLAAYGMTSMRGTGSLWRPGVSREQVDYIGTRDVVRYIRTFGDTFYLDIEHWPVLGVSANEAEKNLAKLIEVARIARRTEPSAKFGIYGVMPQIVYWPIALQEPLSLAQWRESNVLVAPLSKEVDFVFPSLYTFYEDMAGWEKYALEMVKEARRYGKPVYAFIWPQYHDSNATLRGKYLPAAAWRLELEFCRVHTDGVVLWGGPGEPWDENAAWWRETKVFLQTLGKKTREQVTSPSH